MFFLLENTLNLGQRGMSRIEHFLTNKTPIRRISYLTLIQWRLPPSLHPTQPTQISVGPAKMFYPDFDIVNCEGEGGSICNFQCLRALQLQLLSNLSNTDTEGTKRSVRIREVSVLERSLWWRHFNDSTYSFKSSVAKTRLTLVFKLHLKLLIHSLSLFCKCSKQ